MKWFSFLAVTAAVMFAASSGFNMGCTSRDAPSPNCGHSSEDVLCVDACEFTRVRLDEAVGPVYEVEIDLCSSFWDCAEVYVLEPPLGKDEPCMELFGPTDQGIAARVESSGDRELFPALSLTLDVEACSAPGGLVGGLEFYAQECGGDWEYSEMSSFGVSIRYED